MAYKRAAQITIPHNNTPQTQYLDSMGRVFIIEDDNGTFGKYRVHNTLDIGGRPTLVTDAKGRKMTRHFYAYKQPLYTQNIDSGKRWMVGDVAGKPIRTWDERGHGFRNTYDLLQRPLEMFVTENNTEKMVQRQEYGSDASVNNIGQIEKIYDQSGETRITEYDFKGNPLTSGKQYCEDYEKVIDWNQSQVLQDETFNQAIEYDALNRPTLLTQPDASKIKYTYNKGAMLETVEVQHRGQGNYQSYVSNVNYNEKGQRTDIYYGNSSKTKYEYDHKTFRVTRILTTRNTGIDILQNIYYFYDPIGNITEMRDDAQQVHYFNNTVVAPTGKYEYDPLYRLLRAEGRELSSLNAPDSGDFANNIPVPNPSANAMQNYTQLFVYDELGNIQTMSSKNRWTRTYNYNNTANNYLSSTQVGQDVFFYTYDVHGNMTSMPHLPSMQWDFGDRLREVQLNLAGDTAYYIYDSTGNRCRKVIEKGSVREERYYVDGYEVFRKFISGDLDFERESLHISDDEKKFASIETKTIENATPVNPIVAEIRYQYDNHLGSACLELDQTAQIISYEEYHPFGTTSYRSGRTEKEVSLKRYKFQGKEKDEETGLHYHVNRYYAPWIAQWVSVDAKQHEYPCFSPYIGFDNSPVCITDPFGMDGGGDEKTGKIQATVYFQFDMSDPGVQNLTPEQQQAYVNQFQANVRAVWNTYTLADGTQVNVNDVVFAIAPAGMTANKLNANENLLTVGSGVNANPNSTPSVSYVNNNKLRNTGYMYYQQNASEAAHEFGHLLGLADRYIEAMFYSNDSTNKSIGNRLQQGIRINLPLVLPNGESGYNPLTNLYSGNGTTITQKQLSIAFKRGKNEDVISVPVLLHNSPGDINYAAVKIEGSGTSFNITPYQVSQNGSLIELDKKIDWAVQNSSGRNQKTQNKPHFKLEAVNTRLWRANVGPNWVDIRRRSR